VDLALILIIGECELHLQFPTALELKRELHRRIGQPPAAPVRAVPWLCLPGTSFLTVTTVKQPITPSKALRQIF